MIVKRSVFSRIIFATFGPAILIFSGVIWFIASVSYSKAEAVIVDYNTSFVEIAANQIEVNLSKLLATPKLTADLLIDLDFKDGNARNMSETLLKSSLKSSEDIHAIWFAFDPNAFDGKDAQFIQSNNPSGRFIHSFVKNDNQIIEIPNFTSIVETNPEWYSTPRNTGKLYVKDGENYDYLDGYGSKYIEKIVIPIKKDGQIIGCIGVDFLVNEVLKFVDSVRTRDYQHISIYTNDGRTLYDTDKIMYKTFSNIGFKNPEKLKSIMKDGVPYFQKDYSPFSKQAAFVSFAPIKIVGTDKTWTLAMDIPATVAGDEARPTVLKFTVLVIVGLLILAVAAVFVARNVTLPITEITRVANDIAKGHLTHQMSYIHRQDEIGRLSRSLNLMIQQLHEHITAERNSKNKLLIYTNILDTTQKAWNSDQALSKAVEEIGYSTNFERATVIEYVDDYFQPLLHWGEKSELFAEAVSHAVQENEILFVKNESQKEQLQLSKKVKSAVILPLYQFDNYCGFIIFEDSRNKHMFTDDDRELFSDISMLLSNVMSRRKMEQEKNNFTENLEKNVAIRTKELIEMTKMAEDSKLVAEQALQVKGDFLANMSHEIRTPMNAIIGMSELLLLENLNARQLRYVDDIKTSSTSLLGIINDILDRSKIDSGKFSLYPVHYDLPMFLANLMSIITFALQEKKVELIVDIPDDIPAYLYGDDLRLKQVLVNLLGNAVKFTTKGYVKMTVYTTDTIRFDIEDTGSGIKKEDLSRLFRTFEQVDTTKNREIRGTGLGLSIAKSLVEMMGGSIWVDSIYGMGSTFHVEIPFVLGDEKLVEVETVDFSFIYAPSAKILVIDDNDINLHVSSSLLGLCGITCDTVNSGREAIEQILKKDYDLVFMDHMMPEMDGVEATQKIRAFGGKYEDLPIIALTANAVAGAQEMFLTSGMSDFLPKPIDKVLLVQMLCRWLPKEKISPDSPIEAEREHSRSRIIESTSNISELDVELGLKRVDRMSEVYERSLRLFTRTANNSCKKMKKYIEENNLESFAILAHGMKGSLANIGAMKLSEQAAELEMAAKLNNTQFCITHFPNFLELLEGFTDKLSNIFISEVSNVDLRSSGDMNELKNTLVFMYNALDSFESDEASEQLLEIMKYTYGKEIDNLLKQIFETIEAFDFEKGMSIIQELQKNI